MTMVATMADAMIATESQPIGLREFARLRA